MRILIGAPVRQDEDTFKKYLDSLDSLERDNYTFDYFFILHNSPELKKYLKSYQYIEYSSEHKYIKNETHEWTNDNLKDVIHMKNYLLKKAKEENYDFFFLVDSDILMDPKTLVHLIAQKKDIVAEVFWTKWMPEREEEPNAWIYDFYSFDYLKRIKEWRNKGIFEVGGTGACILISKKVLNVNEISYLPIRNISYSLWEDRAFCIRSSVMGFKIFLDTHYPAIHLYR